MEKGIVAKNVCVNMKETYEKEFNQEIERILNELYYNPKKGTAAYKSAIVKTEKRYIDYLIENDLVYQKILLEGSRYDILLERKGYEVFEKYGSWKKYRKKIIDKKNKIEEARNLAQRFWWIPILISVLALGVSIWALTKQ